MGTTTWAPPAAAFPRRFAPRDVPQKKTFFFLKKNLFFLKKNFGGPVVVLWCSLVPGAWALLGLGPQFGCLAESSKATQSLTILPLVWLKQTPQKSLTPQKSPKAQKRPTPKKSPTPQKSPHKKNPTKSPTPQTMYYQCWFCTRC